MAPPKYLPKQKVRAIEEHWSMIRALNGCQASSIAIAKSFNQSERSTHLRIANKGIPRFQEPKMTTWPSERLRHFMFYSRIEWRVKFCYKPSAILCSIQEHKMANWICYKWRVILCSIEEHKMANCILLLTARHFYVLLKNIKWQIVFCY